MSTPNLRAHLAQSFDPAERTLPAMLMHQAQRHGDKPLVSAGDDAWTHEMGVLVKTWDPYKHLATSHPGDNVHQDRKSEWFDFTSFQEWRRPIHGWMVEQRKKQESLGRVIPQTNEEYGYEDHYPRWSPVYPDGASADANRRAAWESHLRAGEKRCDAEE